MNQTPNYQLNQWDAGDRVLRTDFNADNAKIDAALGKKAEAAALTALTQTVNSHTATLSKKGNCRIWSTTYTGDGTYGDGHPKTFTFPGKPLLVVISNLRQSNCLVLTYGATHAYAIGEIESRLSYASWSGNTLFVSSSESASHQMNFKDTPYTVVALMAVD